VHVGLTGEFGAHRVSPRQLLAALQVCGHLTSAQDGSARSRHTGHGGHRAHMMPNGDTAHVHSSTSRGTCVWRPHQDAEDWTH
jgi:hypothetical protein